MKEKTVVVIPCYNEAKTIGQIVAHAKNFSDIVIVINDQSTDDTEKQAVKNGALVFTTYGKHGAGVAIQEGIKRALDTEKKYIIFMDGDGQHNPNEISKIQIALNTTDMVTLSRLVISAFDEQEGNEMPRYRKFGIQVITFAYNFLAKQKLHDAQCGFRGFQRYVLENINVTESGFAYSTEILIKVRKLFEIREVATTAIYHEDFKQNSSLNPIIHGLDVLFRTIKWRIQCELL